MRYWFAVLLIPIVMGACKTQENSSASEKEEFEIEITFSSDEAIKRVPYNQSTIELKLQNALENHGQYRATITVNPDYVDQVIEKLGSQDGVGNVVLIGPANQDP